MIRPGDTLRFGDFTVTVWQFRHIVFDPIYILSVTPKGAVMLPRLLKLAYLNRKMPEKGEIVAYEIARGEKRIFLTGSFRDTPGVSYPKNVDLLVLANGGSVFMPEKSAGFLEKYQPKAVLVDHFDNAFPPVTRTVSVKRLQKTIAKNHPEMRFIVPEICKAIEV